MIFQKEFGFEERSGRQSCCWKGGRGAKKGFWMFVMMIVIITIIILITMAALYWGPGTVPGTMHPWSHCILQQTCEESSVNTARLEVREQRKKGPKCER